MQGGELLERPKEYIIEAEVGQLEVDTFEIKKESRKVFLTIRTIQKGEKAILGPILEARIAIHVIS